MKVVVLLMMVVLFSNGVNADKATDCYAVSDLAKTYIEGRYYGITLPEFMKILDPMATGDEKIFNKSIQAMALRAYSGPLFQTQRRKDKAIASFINKEYIRCLNM